MEFFDENNNIVPYDIAEVVEREHANKYIKPDDCVLELGARYGGVSVTINKILNNKKNQVSVEPDKNVWKALETNKIIHECDFEIIKGTISKKKQKIICDGWATRSVEGGDIDNYEIPNKPFNVLVADCEGFLETFYRENPEFFKQLRLILFEKDFPENCNYDFLIDEFLKLGFKQEINDFQSVFIK
jgi:hypothetical protein